MENYSQYYDLEKYLFDTVKKKFDSDGYLEAFDFFCIVIWKSNRPKSKIAKNILSYYGNHDLNEACKKLTSSIAKAPLKEDKLRVLLDLKGFGLSMASAVLTVLYPDTFTVYDYRVCETETLTEFRKIKDRKTDNAIKKYFEYVMAVHNAVKDKRTLRDKDKELWGKSFAEGLKQDIKSCFVKQK